MDNKAASYQFDDWLVEVDLNQVRRLAKTRRLEPLTMNVMAHLLKNAGQVVTTDDLLDLYWPSRNAHPGMVSRCVTQIRAVLGDDAKNPSYVETIRKRGYRTIANVRLLQTDTSLPKNFFSVAKPLSEPNSDKKQQVRIAVLPFENLSPNPDDAYFAVGVHDEILTHLAKIADISVVAYHSVTPFSIATHSVSSIAGDLGVSAIIAGSLQYVGDRVRISIRLIETATETLNWAETYDRELADIFSIQTDIAMQVAKTMEIQLTRTERISMARPPTSNMEAYTYYIKGIFLLRSFKFAPAIQQLDKAIAIDPYFALALAHKAYVHSIAATSGFGASNIMSASEAIHSISIAASIVQRVFEIDSTQALAHTAQGKVEMYNRNWDSVTRHSAAGYALNPDQVDVAFAHAWSLLDEGRHKMALEIYNQIMVLDPLNSTVPLHASIRVRMAGRPDAAIRLCEMYINEEPADPSGYLLCALSAAFADDHGTAEVLVDQVTAIVATNKLSLTNLICLLEVQQRLGNRKSTQRLEGLVSKVAKEQSFERDASFLYKLACRDAAGALRTLHHAAKRQLPSDMIRDLHHYPENPLFDPIRHHPDFSPLQEIIAKPAPKQVGPGFV